MTSVEQRGRSFRVVAYENNDKLTFPLGRVTKKTAERFASNIDTLLQGRRYNLPGRREVSNWLAKLDDPVLKTGSRVRCPTCPGSTVFGAPPPRSPAVVVVRNPLRHRRVFREVHRQTELEQPFPTDVVCSWLANMPTVAHKHDPRVKDEHFAAGGEVWG